MMTAQDAGRLEDIARARGVDLFGVADLDRIRSETDLLDACYDAYQRGISVGIHLNPAALSDVIESPSRAYCDEYLKVNGLLDAIAEELETEIRAQGSRAVRIPASEVVDWERLRGHLSHKLIGRYAGHGWIGKNILLVNPAFGSRVRYVTVLTDLPLEHRAPSNEQCGGCMQCARACPAGAIADTPAGFNMEACLGKLIEFNEALGEPHFICGVCVSACRGKPRKRGPADGTDSVSPSG